MKPNPNQMGLFMPETDIGWQRPQFLPNWLNRPEITIDLETKDDGLNQERGPGWAFHNYGHISGFAVYDGMRSYYFPLRHPDTDNFDIEQSYRWLKSHITRPEGVTIFFNAMYDTGWILRETGQYPTTPVRDPMAAGVLLNENRRSYSLKSLSKIYGLTGKDKSILEEAAKTMGLHPMKELWKMPAKYVGAYAESDVIATHELHRLMEPELKQENLEHAYHLECDLIEVCVRMRLRGIRINQLTLERRRQEFLEQRDRYLTKISDELQIGRKVDIRDLYSSKTLAKFADGLQLGYQHTRTGAPSFESDWMEQQDHWFYKYVAFARKYEQAAGKFLTQYIEQSIIDGRIHAEIHPLIDRDDRGKGGGTKTYRFSYTNPPLQQMPARDPDIGPMIREVFEPEQGEEWLVCDYSQQEPRFTVHYAAVLECNGWEKAVDYYSNNPDADYHQMVAQLTGLPRSQAKTINLGLAYGMQTAKLAASLKVDEERGKDILELYHAEVPFVKHLTDICKIKASKSGFIKLVDGARCRFELFRPWDQWYGPAYPFEVAQQKWPNQRLSRADVHKSMNRLIQGSSARQTKKAMVDLFKSGYLPLLQLHDDLSFSIGNREQVSEIKKCMVEAYPLKVPMKVEAKIGKNWGQVKG